MLTDASDPLEITDFRFREMRKLCMNKEDEGIPSDAINLVATSSRYGLVFIGVEEGFKVLKLENIFDLNEEDEKRKEAKEFPYQKVASPTPCLLALSADDMTLAVCVTRDSCAVADMYDIRAFADQEEMPVPFTSVRLSSDNNVKLRDLMWNPVVVEMYTFCLSDGSTYVHELSETNLKIAANLPPQTQATAVCWSPKGKEVVVGKKNGSFSRFKPTLQEVKNFPPPAGLDENGVEVVSIYWISTTLFAVVYAPAGDSDDRSPSLVFASTPKGADITYSNFGDVCFGGVCERDPRYIMHYDPEWKILVCVSSNAVESAVVGCIGDEKPIWQQWMLEDSGRADLPLVRNIEPSPIGMAVIYCAQRKILISDTETYPPMPVFFLLSTSGLLCPFHMLNTQPGAANLVYPSEPICREGERKQKGNGMAQPVMNFQKSSSSLTSGNNVIKTVQPHGDTVSTNNINNVIPSVSSVSISSASVLSSQNVAQNMAMGNMQNVITLETNANSFSFVSSQNNQKTLPTPKTGPSLTFGSTKPPSASPSPQTFTTVKPFSMIPSSGTSSFQPQSSATQGSSSTVSSAEQSSKKFALSTVSQPVIQAVTTQNSQMHVNSMSGSQKSLEVIKAQESAWLTESTITSAVLEEIAEFNRELQELKEQSSKFDGPIGTKEEMAHLKKSSLSLIEFHQKMNLAVETLGSEIHSLKNMVLESFAMLSEAESQEKRLKDPKYLSMLRDRALDPRSAKQMQKIQQLNQYLNTQLREINDKLDNDWHEFVQQQKNYKRKGHKLPSAEAIYRTIVSNQNIIYNQKSHLERMIETLNRRKREGQLRGIKLFHNPKIEISNGELGRLADALLQTKINSNDGRPEMGQTARKIISPHKQAALRELLTNRRVTAVKPTVIYSPSQSRLCSALPVRVRTPEMPPVVETQKEEEKLENSEPPVMKGSVPENVPAPFTQEVSAVPPFTAKPATLESTGGITQGIPVAKTLSKPTPSMIPYQAINAGTISAAFKTVQNGASEPSPSSLITKNASQSAFTHLVPSASKPVQESTKLLPQNSTGKPLFLGQNFFQQKSSSNSSFMSVSNIRPVPEMSHVPEFPLSEAKENGNNSGAFTSSSVQASSVGPEPESLGSCAYEDISPPDSPCPPGDESEIDQPSLQTLTRKSASEIPTVSEEKLVTKPATDLKPGSFFFSPVDERKSAVAQKEVPQSQRDISSQQTIVKGTEISSASSQSAVLVTSSNEYAQTGLTTASTNQQIQNTTLGQSASSIPPAFVSSVVPTTQTMVSSPANPSTNSSVLVIQSPPHINQKESSDIATQAESPFASVKLSAATTPLPSSLQPNVGKVAAFTFALPKEMSNQKEVKTADTAVPTSTVPSGVSSTSVPSSGDPSAVDQPGDDSVEKPATPQKTVFGSVPPATVTSSATVFGQPSLITSSTVPSSTPPAQPLFGQVAAPVNASSSVGSFGVTPVTQSSSVFGQKTVTTTTTTSTVSTTATTTASTISFFGQQSSAQSSFFGKTTLTSPVFGQTPQAQSSVFGQTVNSASSPSFGQTGTSSFFNQTAGTGVGSFLGQKAQSPGSSSAFGQSTGASGFSFQKASMEQQNSSSFGLTKSVFGQSSVFGQQQNTTSSPFGQSPSSSTSGGIFGQGSFFSGLGGKPSEENASKNVFASTVSSPSTNTSIFGNQGASSFGSKLGGSFSGGSFSSGSGTVAQSGFGAFQQTPQKTSGFGAPPSFGGSPTFGNSSNFGGSPTFGSGIAAVAAGSPLGNSAFGSTQGEGFGSFASSNSPTFGSLASQSGGFGSAAQQQSPSFGALSSQSPPSAFGAGSPVFGGSPGFGAGQSSFGSPTNATQSSAFSQWRN